MFRTYSILDDWGKFIELYEAQENPRKKGEYIVPSNAVRGEPTLVASPGMDRYYVNGGWEYREIPTSDAPNTPVLTRNDVALAYMDGIARERGWVSIADATSRAGYAGPFRTEGVRMAMFADRVRLKAMEVEAQITAGSLPVPTNSDFQAMLPAYDPAAPVPELPSAPGMTDELTLKDRVTGETYAVFVESGTFKNETVEGA